MTLNVETTEILHVLNCLPPEKVAEVKDRVNFLKSQYLKSQVIDESDEWSDEDLRDITAFASARFVEISV